MPDEEAGASGSAESAPPPRESLLSTMSSAFKNKLWEARQSQLVREGKEEKAPEKTTLVVHKPVGPVYTPPWSTEKGWTHGWERLKSIYSSDVSMERDMIRKVCTSSFIVCFMIGGATGYQEASRIYEQTHVGKKYLSHRDALVRRIDYGILKFAINGTRTGLKGLLLTGSIIGSTLLLSAYRAKFSPLYFPAFSGAVSGIMHGVGGIFTFPLGIIGVAKAVGLGITSGLTLAGGYQLFAMSIDKKADEAYWYFKNEYEKDLQSKLEFDLKVRRVMVENPDMWWKANAIRHVKKMEELDRQRHDF